MVVTIGKIPKLVKREYRFPKRTKKTMPKLSAIDRKRAEHLQRMTTRGRYTPAMLSARDRSLLAQLETKGVRPKAKGTIGERIRKPTPWLEAARGFKGLGREVVGAYKSRRALTNLIRRRAIQQLRQRPGAVATKTEITKRIAQIKKGLGL